MFGGGVQRGMDGPVSIEITHVRFENNWDRKHQSIIRYKWRSSASGEVSESDKSTLVDWIENQDGKAYVKSVPVVVVREAGQMPYLRTKANGVLTDNLINLPTF